MKKNIPTTQEILIQYRDDNGMNSTEFAKALKLSKQRVHGWISGQSRPTVEWLQVMALREDWQGDLARDLLRERGLAVLSV